MEKIDADFLLKAFKKAMKIGFLVYLGFGLVLFFFQRHFVYYSDKQNFNSCSGFADSQSVNANETRAYYKNNSKKLLVFYHGNAGSACDRSFLKNEFEKLDYSYIFVEYAGYSNDSRTPSKESLMKDAENINEFLKTTNHEKLVLAGESLGAAIAAYHSSFAREDQLLLISPFYKMEDVAREHYPMYPVSFLLREKYDISRWTGDINQVEIIHGAKDKIIPATQGKKLFESIESANKKFVEIKDASHNDIYYYPETFFAISDFLGE